MGGHRMWGWGRDYFNPPFPSLFLMQRLEEGKAIKGYRWR